MARSPWHVAQNRRPRSRPPVSTAAFIEQRCTAQYLTLAQSVASKQRHYGTAATVRDDGSALGVVVDQSEELTSRFSFTARDNGRFDFSAPPEITRAIGCVTGGAGTRRIDFDDEGEDDSGTAVSSGLLLNTSTAQFAGYYRGVARARLSSGGSTTTQPLNVDLFVKADRGGLLIAEFGDIFVDTDGVSDGDEVAAGREPLSNDRVSLVRTPMPLMVELSSD